MAILIAAGAIVLLCLLANLVFFIIVLIKLFKKEGPLLGIVGLIFGIVTFIWGWIKHKQLELTKVMIIWTVTIVLPPVLAIGIPFVAPNVEVTKKLISKAIPGTPVKPARQPIIKRSVPKQKVPQAKKKPSRPRSPAKKAEQVDYDAKIDKLNDLIKKDSENKRAIYNRAWLYAEKGEILKAINDYSRVIEIDNEFSDAYYNRGLLYAKMDRNEQAVSDFTKAIKMDAQSFDAYCNRGNVYHKMGKDDLAVKDYTEALRLKSDDGVVYHNRSVVYRSMGEKSKAEADAEKAARLMKESGLKPVEGAGVKETPSKPSAATWKRDLKDVKIPDSPATGMINGEVFITESSKIENGILTLRDGKEFFPDHAVTVFLFLKGESPDGKSYDIGSESGFGSPHIHMKWRPENSKTPKSRVFMKGYSMRLEFGQTQDGKLPGKIYLCLPDEKKSCVAGSFVASVKGKQQTKKPAPKE